MEAEAFDRLVKRMGGAADRRRLLLVGFGAALAGLLGPPVAAKDRDKRNGKKDPDKGNGQPCNKNAQCRSRHCCSAGGKKDGRCRECCNDGDCGPGRLCQNKECVPDPGTCTAGQNICQDPGTSDCNNQGTCDCVITTLGARFCGLARQCSNCSRDEDCATVTGPGSVCTDTTGRFCGCQETNRRACVGPCGTCTRDAQCGDFQVCCGGQCRIGDCCTAADCGAGETCEEECIGAFCRGLCTCAGCQDGNRCPAGNTWAQCGANGAPCAACGSAQICDAGRQTCVACDVALFYRPTVTWCEAVNNFATFQCGPNCSCATAHSGVGGACWDLRVRGYCNPVGADPICNRNEDCVAQGDGNYCVQAGACEQTAGCEYSVCVTACGAGDGNASADDGPPRIVVRD